jgi:hypothetical protein
MLTDLNKEGFYARHASCEFRYTPGFFENIINEQGIQLYNVKKEMIYCKNDVEYIRCFIDNIKERVIKNCKTLSSVKIILATFDKNNTIHRLIVVISRMMMNLLQIRDKINLYKSIIVCIEYEGKMIFMGDLNFTGLQ